MENYILKDGVPVIEPDILVWAKWFETADRKVALTIVGDTKISTVFLGKDHSFGHNDLPILYETLVFGGKLDDEMERYTTIEEARLGHEIMVTRVRESQV